MSVIPEGLKPGRCYLTHSRFVRRIDEVLEDGAIRYGERPAEVLRAYWSPGVLDLSSFTREIEREVPCQWMPD